MTSATGIESYLGFAVRANKVVYGLECLLRLRQTPEVVLFDESLGNSAKRKAQHYCEIRNTAFMPVREGFLNDVLKRNNVKLVAITDKSLGGQIKRILASK